MLMVAADVKRREREKDQKAKDRDRHRSRCVRVSLALPLRASYFSYSGSILQQNVSHSVSAENPGSSQ